VVCKGAGAGVLKDVDLMIRLTKAVIDSTFTVTVKTVWVGMIIRLILMK
jgi:tRNA-dihydrouridine synthase